MSGHPPLDPVQSSNIAALGHHDGHLYVKFHSGAVWRYKDVPPAAVEEMKASGSLGKYLHAFIKPNHEGEKVS